VLGLVLLAVHRSLGIYLLAGAAGMAIRAQIIYAEYRDQYLDRMDSLIEAEFWSGDHKESGKEANAGFSPVRMSADLAAMIAKSETELARRGVKVPATPSSAQPFEDVDAAVRASMTSVETRPIPTIKRPESELEAPAGDGRSRLTSRPAEEPALITPATPAEPVSAPAAPPPQPQQKPTPPPKPPDEWGDY
jgi:hypothetical protein